MVRVLALTVALGVVQHYRNDLHPANEASRIYAALAIVDHGTVALDPVFDDIAPGWRGSGRPPNRDVSVFEGSYRLDKAPGVTLLAVPVLGAMRLAGLEPSFSTLAWLLSLLFSALPAALFAEGLRRRLLADRMPPAISAGIVLATPWMAYGGMLFGHSLAAALAGGGMLLALGPIPVDPERSGAPGEAPGRDRFRTAVAGLLLGLAVLTEYPAVVLAILVAASLAVDPARRRLLPWLALGALPAVAGLLAWNQANFEIGRAHV